MKRLHIVLCACMLLFALALSGCGGTKENSDATADDANAVAAVETSDDATTGEEIIEIKEKFFIQQCNDIYYNPDFYEGTVVKLEGMYDEYFDDYREKTASAVYRNGPGCCGNDGVAGFEFSFDGELPERDDWISVTGVVELETNDDGFTDVILRATAVDVKAERGAEFVKN
jgi:uncharacterized membrane protein YcgQ (UPF0703/DUF1980 family)